MSLLTTISLAVVALPALGAAAGLVFLFKPLLAGLLRAALLLLRPRRSHAQKMLHRSMKSVLLMSRMARDLESTNPSLASELRSIAARG